MNTDRVKQSINKLIDMFQRQDFPNMIARTVIQEASNEKPSDRWSLANRLIMQAEGTLDARGYNQWKQVGRHVKKGAKAIYILAPVTKAIKVTKVSINDKGEEVKEEIVVNKLVGFKEIPVFRFEDTEGEDLKTPSYEPKTLPPLIDVARKYGIEVKYSPFTERFYGCYTPGRKEIMLCSHDVDVFFHELAHAIHGSFRQLKGGQHPDQEIVAETVAQVLCVMYGYQGHPYEGYRYIKHYAEDKDPVRAVMRVIADIERVLRIIIGEEEKIVSNVEDTAA